MLQLLLRALAAGRGFMAGQGTANQFASNVQRGTFAGFADAFRNRQQTQDDQTPGVFRSFQSGAGGGGGALGGLYQAARDAAPPLVKLGMEVADIPGRIREWGQQLVESQRYLSQYNGTIAGVTAQLDADRIKRSIDKGQMTGESFEGLTKAQSQLEESLQPFDAAWANISNSLTATFNNLTAGFVDGIASLPVVSSALEYFSNEKAKDNTKEPFVNEAFHTMADDIRKKNRQPLPKL